AEITAGAGWPAAAGAVVTGHLPAGPDATAVLRLGADLHRLRAALAAEGVASTLLVPPAPTADGGLALLAL
ncbi:F420-0--gamma-glutamyl ligase, partial [Polymorphospora sp. 2-325]